MFGEIFKILSDEPEKIEKAVLRAIKLALTMLIAVQIYKWVFGPFIIFPLDSYDDWTDFFLSGKVFICLLFYFISDYLITPLIHLLAYGIAILLTRFNANPTTDDFRLLLKTLRVVNYQEANEIPQPGRNIDLLYKLSQAFANEDARNEIDSLKDTYIGNVLNLYSLFCLVYFTLFSSELRTPALNIIIITVLVLVLIIYAVLHGILDYMSKHHQEIITGLSFIKTNAVIMSILGSYAIFPAWGTKENRLHRVKFFIINNKEYAIIPGLNGRRIRPGEIEKFIDRRSKEGRIFLLVIEKGLIANSQELLLKYFDSLLLIEFSDEKNLRDQLKNTLESLLPR